MKKMAVYLEANVILGSSLSPNNYCICKSTAIANGADVEKINSIVINAPGNRLLPVSAITSNTPAVNSYTIRFLDWDGTVLKTETVVEGNTPTPPINPTRSGYTFTGWSPSIGAANRNQDYTATYSDEDIFKFNISYTGNEFSVKTPYVCAYMDDGSFLTYDQINDDNKSRVQAVAILDLNRRSVLLIDKYVSPKLKFGIRPEGDVQSVYGSGGAATDTLGRFLTNFIRNNFPLTELQNTALDYCRTRFNGTGFIPSSTEYDAILHNDQSYYWHYNSVQLMLDKIGGDPILISDGEYYWTSDIISETSSGDYRYEYKIRKLHKLSEYDSSKGWVNSSENWVNIEDEGYVRAMARLNWMPSDLYTTEWIRNILVDEGVIPQCPDIPTRDGGWEFAGWYPIEYPANKDQIYRPIFFAVDEPVPEIPDDSSEGSGRFGFGTDTDGETKGRFLRIETNKIPANFPKSTVTFSVSGSKYIYDSSTGEPKSTTHFSGTITLKDWNTGNASCSTTVPGLDVSMAGSAQLGWMTYVSAPVSNGVWYIFDMSSSDIGMYPAHYVNAEGNSSYGYYHRVYI